MQLRDGIILLSKKLFLEKGNLTSRIQDEEQEQHVPGQEDRREGQQLVRRRQDDRQVDIEGTRGWCVCE